MRANLYNSVYYKYLLLSGRDRHLLKVTRVLICEL